MSVIEHAESKWPDYCTTLLGLHVFTGEDVTSTFKGKGKVGSLKKLQSYKCITQREYLHLYSDVRYHVKAVNTWLILGIDKIWNLLLCSYSSPQKTWWSVDCGPWRVGGHWGVHMRNVWPGSWKIGQQCAKHHAEEDDWRGRNTHHQIESGSLQTPALKRQLSATHSPCQPPSSHLQASSHTNILMPQALRAAPGLGEKLRGNPGTSVVLWSNPPTSLIDLLEETVEEMDGEETEEQHLYNILYMHSLHTFSNILFGMFCFSYVNKCYPFDCA